MVSDVGVVTAVTSARIGAVVSVSVVSVSVVSSSSSLTSDVPVEFKVIPTLRLLVLVPMEKEGDSP